MILSGVLLVVLSSSLTVHGLRAGAAQALYCRAKYGADRHDLHAVLRLCDRAQRLYPWNYYFCLWAAENAYDARHDGTEVRRRECLAAARRWCDAGLTLNVYRSPLRLLKTRLIEEESASAAAAYWAKYVDWDFWQPSHHAVLVELYSHAGDFDRAMQSLRWVERSPFDDEARRNLQDAWEKAKRSF